MAIVPLDKLTLIGTESQRETVLDGLQRLGCLHLLDLAKVQGARPGAPVICRPAREALGYLRACPVQRRQARSRKGYDCPTIDAQALQLKRRQEKLEDERDELGNAIKELQPWGEFDGLSPEELRGWRFWPFVLSHQELAELKQSTHVWQVVAKGPEQEYVMVLSKEAPVDVPGNRIELDPRPLSELKARAEEIEEELDELYWERVGLTRWCAHLEHDLNEADDEAARQVAAGRALQQDGMFALQAWAPRVAGPDIRRFAEEQQLALVVDRPADAEKPPTLLKNPERLAGAEGAVTFYITPEYGTWDPTPVVFFSFSLFFAMIFADAGYALLLAGLLLFLRKRLSQTRAGRRFRDLLAALVVATFVYGVLVGSYFGLGPPPLLAPLKILDVQNQGTMMALAVVIGVAHLTLANVIVAWHSRRSLQCLSPLGWVAMLLGGLLLAGGTFEAAPFLDRLAASVQRTGPQFYDGLKVLGEYLLVGGGVAVLLFSSQRPLFPFKLGNWLGRMLDGLQQVPRVSKAFGDVLSYLRLFALGLASAQLASTFNHLAAGAAKEAGIGFLLAVLIVLVGHGINLLLGIMSGVVHGLRLNCIEFFDWSLKGEGYAFQAFRKKAEQ